MHLTEEQQHIACQMGECSITLLILTPAPVNLSTKECELLVVPRAFGVIGGQGIALLFVPGTLLLEFINLSAGAGLSAIETTGVEEKWPTDLLAVFVHRCCGQ